MWISGQNRRVYPQDFIDLSTFSNIDLHFFAKRAENKKGIFYLQTTIKCVTIWLNYVGSDFMAEWLNVFFAQFDSLFLGVFAYLSNSAGGFFTPIMRFISLIGEKGILVLAVALVFLLFKKSRPSGIAMIGALVLGTIVTSFVLKNSVARLRPFEQNATYAEWWAAAGAVEEDGFSFPSGHVTAAMAGAAALFACSEKKSVAWLAFFYPIVMGISRVYLVAHYPSDVLFGMLVGAACAVAAYFITKAIFALCEKYREKKFFAFVLDFDLAERFRKSD